MTEQQRLEAWILPYECDVVFARHTLRPFSPLSVQRNLIAVEQDKASIRRGTSTNLLRDMHHSHLDPRERIAGASAQIVNFQIKRPIGFIDEVLKQGRISGF